MEKGLGMDRGFRRFIFIGLVITILIAAFISPFASKSPDGLEKVAADKGFLNMAKGVWRYSPFSDYSLAGIENKYISTGLTGIIGVIIVFVITLVFAKRIIKKRANLNTNNTKIKFTTELTEHRKNNKEKWGNSRKGEWKIYFILSFLHLSTCLRRQVFSLSP